MATFGTTTVHLNRDNYTRKELPADINKIQLLPKAGSTDHCESWQQKGRGRYQFKSDALVETWAEFDALQADCISKDTREFTDGTYTLDCKIEYMGPPIEKVPGQIIFSIVITEA